MWSFEFIVMLGMIGLNGLFAAYEIALASVSIARLQMLVREGRAGAQAALYMKENVEASFAAVQLGITFVGAVAAAVGGAGAEESLAPWLQTHAGLHESTAEWLAILLVVLPLIMATVVVGELIPKVFALRNKEWVCLRLSTAMRWFALSVWPIVWLFESLVTATMRWGEKRWRPDVEGEGGSEAAELRELRAMAGMAHTLALIGSRQEAIIVSAASLATRTVQDIMLPAAHISLLHVDASLSDCLIAAHLDMHTRFPVTERAGDPQAILGYVNFKDIVAQMRLVPNQPSLRGILRPIPSVAERQPIASCLEMLMREHTHITLVRDERGSVVGLVTLEDVLEELVGDIQDEFDRLPIHATETGAGWVVGGGLTLARLKELSGIDLAADPPPDDARRVTDWIAGHLGRGIQAGDILERNSLRLVVRKIRRANALEVQITRTGQ